jgi:hypothetical protein
MHDPEDDIVNLATASNAAQAHIWQQALRDEGIESQVVGDFLDVGFAGHPGQTAEVWVHRDLYDRALEILKRGERNERAAEGEAAD